MELQGIYALVSIIGVVVIRAVIVCIKSTIRQGKFKMHL